MEEIVPGEVGVGVGGEGAGVRAGLRGWCGCQNLIARLRVLGEVCSTDRNLTSIQVKGKCSANSDCP